MMTFDFSDKMVCFNKTDAVEPVTFLGKYPSEIETPKYEMHNVAWYSFHILDHLRCISREYTIPLLAFGEMLKENGHCKFLHSVHAHHTLVDGQHMEKYF